MDLDAEGTLNVRFDADWRDTRFCIHGGQDLLEEDVLDAVPALNTQVYVETQGLRYQVIIWLLHAPLPCYSRQLGCPELFGAPQSEGAPGPGAQPLH